MLEVPITPAAAEELHLSNGTNHTEDTVDAPQELLESCDVSACVEGDTNACALRFHELVDREFLGNLTSEEIKELEVLTKWRDDQKSAFYRSVAVE